jgi:hypothetical protein
MIRLIPSLAQNVLNRMPRPNHDIPRSHIGGIGDYADARNISTDAAHAELLALALRETGMVEIPYTISVEKATKAVEEFYRQKRENEEDGVEE